MQERLPKSDACHNFWQPLVKKIYAQNADVISLQKRDVLAAFTRLQKAKPDYGFEISYKQGLKGYRDCDKSQIIYLRKSLGSAASIEFMVDCDTKYLSIRFSHIDVGNFNVPYERCLCNLEATLGDALHVGMISPFSLNPLVFIFNVMDYRGIINMRYEYWGEYVFARSY